MDIDYVAKLASIAGTLLQGVCWPAVVFVIFLYYRRTVQRLMDEAGSVSVKAGVSGFEASVNRRIAEASASLGAAEASRTSAQDDGMGTNVGSARQIADMVSQVITPQAIRRLDTATILWVDDRPMNNLFERESLEALGLHIDLATSTEEALNKVARRSYDAIITDMGRPPDARAGYTLLSALRERKLQTPVIIYAGSNLPEHRAEAQQRGAIGSTNNPRELFQLVIEAIMGR